MSKKHNARCNIQEFDLVMWCRKKATVWSWIDEYDGSTTIVDLCTNHEKWLARSKQDYDLDYKEWSIKYV